MDWRHFEGLNTYSPWLQLFKYQKVEIFQIMNMMMGKKCLVHNKDMKFFKMSPIHLEHLVDRQDHDGCTPTI